MATLCAIAGCGSSTSRPPLTRASDPTAADRSSSSPIRLPPVHGRFSYQIGGAYAPPASVTIIDRDHDDPALPGTFSICYVNAFQAQQADSDWWQRNHLNALLRDAAGRLIVDTQWHEPLFDIASPTHRAEVLTVLDGWLDQCVAAGYQAVEADNLDSYTRSKGQLTEADALGFGAALAVAAHRRGLSLAQKNAVELSRPAHAAGFDFAVAEECQVFSECDTYRDVYGAQLIEIEYSDQPVSAFTTACALRGSQVSVVLRDRDVIPAGATGHVERWC